MKKERDTNSSLMESYLTPHHYDLVTPDGRIIALEKIDERRSIATVLIEQIFP